MPAHEAREARRVFGMRLGPGAIAAALLVLLALPFVPRVLRACGPYFPLEILSSRENAVLESPPSLSVTAGLVPAPGDEFLVNEGDNEEARARVEFIGLSAEQQARVRAMRALADGDAAYAAGNDLPPMVRDYTAGAVSYHHKQLDKARDYFTRALTHKSDDVREVRPVWARYMLGGIARLQGDAEGAAEHWAATRGLVRSGQSDTLGLAVASLGEEARLWLKPGTLAKAVSLYAKQASYGSERGRASLFMIAEQALGDPALLDEGLRRCHDPAADSALPVCARRRGWPGLAHRRDNVRGHDGAFQARRRRVRAAARLAGGRRRSAGRPGIQRGALRAGRAIRRVRVDAAVRLDHRQAGAPSRRSPGGAALIFRRGERAAGAWSPSPTAPWRRPACCTSRAATSRRRWNCSRARSSTIRRMCYTGPDYWPDAAYLAERVLTLEELLPLVDRLAPPLSSAEVDAITKNEALPESEWQWREELPAEQLRELAGPPPDARRPV